MKKSLLIAAMSAMTLAACSKKPTDEQLRAEIVTDAATKAADQNKIEQYSRKITAYYPSGEVVYHTYGDYSSLGHTSGVSFIDRSTGKKIYLINTPIKMEPYEKPVGK